MPKSIIYQELQYHYQWPITWFWYKRYKETRNLSTDQGRDYTTGCLLNCEYIKNHYRLID